MCVEKGLQEKRNKTRRPVHLFMLVSPSFICNGTKVPFSLTGHHAKTTREAQLEQIIIWTTPAIIPYV